MLIKLTEAGSRLARALQRYKDRLSSATVVTPPLAHVAQLQGHPLKPPGDVLAGPWLVSHRSDASPLAEPAPADLAGEVNLVTRYGEVQGIPPGAGGLPASPADFGPAAGERIGTLTGQIDLRQRDLFEGWAYDDAAPPGGVSLIVLVDGVEIKRLRADRFRPDLQAAGIGDGRHAFSIAMPWLSPSARHVVCIKRAADGRDLVGSPCIMEPSASFDAVLEQCISQSLSALEAGAELDRVLSFLLAQTDQLLQRRAVIRGAAGGKRPQQVREPRPPAVAVACHTGPRQSALVIDRAMPRPDAGLDAGSEAIVAHMRALQALNYRVQFMVAQGPVRLDEAAAALEAMDIACCRAPFYVSVEEALRRLAGGIDIVYLHRLPDTAGYIPIVRECLPTARILFSVADFTHVRLAREHGLEVPPAAPAESRAIRWTEIAAAEAASTAITHSTVEAAMLRQAVPGAVVRPPLWRVAPRPPAAPFERRGGVAFIGGSAQPASAEAATFLVEEVMPVVWQAQAAIECRLVCTAMSLEMKRLERPGVVVVGPVAELAAELGRVRVTVAPRGGVVDEVLASLAAGVPCALTTAAAAAIDWPMPLSACVGDTVGEMASAIVRLHEDASANAAAAAAGLALVAQRSDEASVQAALQAAIEGWHEMAAD
jgi:hypothetical protein